VGYSKNVNPEFWAKVGAWQETETPFLPQNKKAMVREVLEFYGSKVLRSRIGAIDFKKGYENKELFQK